MSERESGFDMEQMWGTQIAVPRAEDATRGQLFNDGNYALFIHWGPYSHLANKLMARRTMALASGSCTRG